MLAHLIAGLSFAIAMTILAPVPCRSGAGSEVLRRFRRDDRNRDRRRFASHRYADFAAEGFRDAERAAHPVRSINNLRPNRT